jgi:TonB family protein
VILKLSVLMALACVLDLALRRAPAAMRHLNWALALAGALLLPLGGLYAPKVAGAAFAIRTSTVAGTLIAPVRFPWAMAIYGVGAAVLLVRLLADILAANRAVKQARATSLPGVLVSDCAAVPFAWGRIVVPAGFETHEAVIAHERAHVERWDAWTAVMARVACAVYWFHPLVWWAAARMRLEADRACDDAVLRGGFADTGYAEELVEMARGFGRAGLAPAAVERSQLEVRVRHILSGGVDRRKLSAAAVCVAVLGCAAVVSPLAAVTQERDERVYRVGPGISPPSVLHKVNPDYTRQARAAKISGVVLLSVVVDSDGTARNLRVVRGVDSGLDQNAVAAVKKWKFRPARKDGQPVSVNATIEVHFRLL